MQPQEVGAGELLANLSIGYILLAIFVLTVLRLVLYPLRAPLARSVSELTESLLVAGVLVFLIIRPFLLQAFYIPSESMEPTLLGHKKGYDSNTGDNYAEDVNDRLFVYKFGIVLNKLGFSSGLPDRGDIVVFKAPKQADFTDLDQGKEPVENVLIKRMIGKPGDVIEVKKDDKDVMRVFRNGVALPDPYIKEPMSDLANNRATFAIDRPLTLGPGEYFVMGDNRNHSNDSRFWGVVTQDRIIGRAVFIFWPLNRIRTVH